MTRKDVVEADADRRNTIYSLSKKGRKYIEPEFERKIEFLDRCMEELSCEDRENLSMCMEKLEKILKRIL